MKNFIYKIKNFYVWNLDNTFKYERIGSFTLNYIFTFGSKDDIQKRESISSIAKGSLSQQFFSEKGWEFRIFVTRDKRKPPIDIDNVIKLIVDAFSCKQIKEDNSVHCSVALYR